MTPRLSQIPRIPTRWAGVLTRLTEATVAGEIMADHYRADGKDRDLATDRYVTAVDALVAELQVLKQAGVLERISLFLAANAAPEDRPGA